MLEVHTEQLLVAARHIAVAAEALTAAAATPPAHPPVATDEISTSAAARLTEHGVVLASRASDGAAVLSAAAVAITQAAGAFAQMDRNNAQTVSLRGIPGAPAVTFTPAATVNAPDPSLPIAAPLPRDGRITAAVVESGNASAGSTFITNCAAHAAAFRSAAQVVRTAKVTVESAVTGKTGPALAAGLTSFGTWADSMASHADTVKAAGQGHSQRFVSTQRDTPRTQQFADLQRRLAEATALNSRPATLGMYTPVVQGLQTQLAGLHTKAGGSMQSYHLAELPSAPPPPPPVVPIVSGTPAASPAAPGHSGDRPADGHQPSVGPADEEGLGGELAAAADDPALAGLLGEGTDDLTGLGSPLGAGAPGGDPASMISMVAGTVPGLLSGVVSAAAAIPAAMAQQAQQAVSQVVEGVGGAVSEMQKPGLDVTDPSLGLGGYGEGPGLGAGGGGGGGGTTPAAGGTPLAPGSTGMMSMGAGAGPAAPPIAGASTPGTVTPAGAVGPMGAPMMMPPMGGMGMGAGGGSGTRRLSEPTKEVHIEPVPNSEPVRGEVVRRLPQQPLPGSAAPPAAPAPQKTATVTSARRGRRVITTDEDVP
ncbi:PE domain-containing protein [Mycolicibacterium mucogenicum]|uniref:PE domain-containing protein n=1 Tax=Mycolicibacterium mucogenicum TaxID=56689 RepID=UPI00226A60E8|nr:PE domain-containing protein [Mycolicibacterium mucogenicum]MCX8565114.1 PE domain-containing protein [Mycolicibacterium mucogenicum]